MPYNQTKGQDSKQRGSVSAYHHTITAVDVFKRFGFTTCPHHYHMIIRKKSSFPLHSPTNHHSHTQALFERLLCHLSPHISVPHPLKHFAHNRHIKDDRCHQTDHAPVIHCQLTREKRQENERETCHTAKEKREKKKI
jgi:hypothetical protein